MIKVTIELYPFGSEKNKKTLSEIKIGNTCYMMDNAGLFSYLYNGSVKQTDDVDYFFRGVVLHNRNNNMLALLKNVLDDYLMNNKEKISNGTKAN